MMGKSYNAKQLQTLMRSRRVSFGVAARSFDLVASRGCSLDAALGIAMREEQDEVAGRRAVGKPATTSGKAQNPFSILASREHRQRNAVRRVISGSPAPAPSAPTPAAPKSKSMQIGKIIFAGSLVEHLEGGRGR